MPPDTFFAISFIRQYFSPKDLAQFQKQFKLPERPIDKVVGKNVEAFPGAEASLDVEASVCVPWGCSICACL
jgi:subtilase family serine protease